MQTKIKKNICCDYAKRFIELELTGHFLTFFFLFFFFSAELKAD